MTGDGELVRRACGGDRHAYGELARRWSRRILATCRARLRSSHAAEDATQEALMRGWRSIETLDRPERFGSWLRGIAVRICLDWWRSRQNGQVVFSTLAEERFDPAAEPDGDPLERADEARRLREELDGLDVDQRETLMLYYTRELTYRELADLLGLSVSAVNARLNAARETLRMRLTRPGVPAAVRPSREDES